MKYAFKIIAAPMCAILAGYRNMRTALAAESYNRTEGATKGAAQVASRASAPPQGRDGEKQGMSFWDALDVINPFQHIPVVNKIYQAVTGDTIKAPARLAGAALFFGPVGLAVAAADEVVRGTTGKGAQEHVASVLGLEVGSTGDASAGSPVDAKDDPFTVTAPRPGTSRTSAQALPTVNNSQANSAKPATRSGAASATLPVAADEPAADAARMAAAGFPPAAALASLPVPGAAGLGDSAVVASLQKERQAADAQPSSLAGRAGKSLSDYRASSLSAGGTQPRPLLAPAATQIVQQARASMPKSALAAPLSLAASGQKMPTAQAEPAQPISEPPKAAWPPEGPTALPKELVADMMAQALQRYEQSTKKRTPQEQERARSLASR
jgi:hypothetical protein